jgi:hypothetical protein
MLIKIEGLKAQTSNKKLWVNGFKRKGIIVVSNVKPFYSLGGAMLSHIFSIKKYPPSRSSMYHGWLLISTHGTWKLWSLGMSRGNVSGQSATINKWISWVCETINESKEL